MRAKRKQIRLETNVAANFNFHSISRSKSSGEASFHAHCWKDNITAGVENQVEYQHRIHNHCHAFLLLQRDHLAL